MLGKDKSYFAPYFWHFFALFFLLLLRSNLLISKGRKRTLSKSPAYCAQSFGAKRHDLGDVMFVVFHNIPSLLPRLVKVSHARTPTG